MLPLGSGWISLLDWAGWDDWDLTGGASLATDPVDPNRLYIAAGTYTNSWSPANASLLRSTDQGKTFTRIPLPFKLGGNMPGRSMGERLAIDPNKNSILYFAAPSGNGLWKSTDFGSNWAKVNSFPAAGTYVQDPANEYTADIIGVVWVTFDPRTGTSGTATKTIYVGVAEKAGASVYKSTDGGNTWAAVPGQPIGYLPHHGILGSNGILYVCYSDTCGPYDGAKGDVYKLDTATGTWTLISPVPSSSDDNYWGYGGLAVDAQNPNTIMVTTLNSWWPDAVIFRSTDAGATWKRIWEWGAYPERILHYTMDISVSPWLDWGNTAILPEISPKLGWMIGNVAIDPFNSNKFLYGTGATVYGTDNLLQWDSGGTITITVKARGIEQTSVGCVVSPPSGPQLYSGVGDINGFVHTDVTKVPSKMFLTPGFATTSLDYAELVPNFVCRTGNASSGMHTGFSYDNGSNWFQGNSEPGGVTNGGTIAAAADAGCVVWAPENLPPVYSKDNGNSWITVTGLPNGSKVGSDRVNADKFYAYAAGKFYVSTDGGANFTVTAATGLHTTGSQFHPFKALPGREGDIWLVGGSTTEGVYGMWHSTDSGASFTKLTNVEQADTIGFGKAAAGKNYMAIFTSAKIGSVRGFFRSDDGGASWIRVNDDQHQYAWTGSDITGDPRIFGRYYFGTNGRGVVYGDPAGAVPAISPTATMARTATRTATRTGIKGDVNGDNSITIVDALMAAQYSVGLSPSPFNPADADVNCDGSITIIDALMIAQRYVGLILVFSC